VTVTALEKHTASIFMEMEAVYYSETFVSTNQTSRFLNLEEYNINLHSHENLISCIGLPYRTYYGNIVLDPDI
jgi:hypothetical protein